MMVRCLVLTLLAAVVALATAPAATAARPLFAGTWSGKLQSTKVKGPNGRLPANLSFERPGVMRFTAYRARGIRKLKLKLSRGWYTTPRFSVRHHCYRASYVYRLKPTRVLDMEGERVVSRMNVRYFRSSRTCGSKGFRNGNRLSEWLVGTVKRDAPPESGSADISFDSPDGCDPALVEHSAREGDSFLDWDSAYSYLWSFSDGATSTAPRPRHRYPGPGEHRASVLIRSIGGSVAKGSQTVTVAPPQACG